MARRIEVELTSSREDGTWTWRAAGARQPKGELDGQLLYPQAKVGDVVKVEAEFHLDGIEVTTVFPPKEAKARPDMLELVSRPLRDDELVTTTRAPRREAGRGDDRRRGPRREGGPRGEEGRREGAGRREGRPVGDRERGRRMEQEQEARPKARRLRPRRNHRDAVVAEVPEEYRPIAERLMSGGIPEVRKALDEQNAAARAAGGPELSPGPILAIAEDLFPKLRTAEWRDRADAALADLDELDLRDLRSVVVAADAAARDEQSRALAEQLRDGLNRRVEADHEQWMRDLTSAVGEGRVVRALRLSSRPVKAGAPLPAELAATLAESTSAALAPDISQDRWATVLDAVAFSPVRSAVTPAGVPAEPTAELREAVTKVADRVPHIASLFGIDPLEAARGRARTRRPRTRKPEGERPAGAGPKAAQQPSQPAVAPPASGEGQDQPSAAPAEPAAQPPATPQQPATGGAAEQPASPAAPEQSDGAGNDGSSGQTDALTSETEQLVQDLGGLPDAPAEGDAAQPDSAVTVEASPTEEPQAPAGGGDESGGAAMAPAPGEPTPASGGERDDEALSSPLGVAVPEAVMGTSEPRDLGPGAGGEASAPPVREEPGGDEPAQA